MCCCNRKKGLPPIVDDQSVVLILGTMPGDESLAKNEYYANPNNQFWKILGEVYGEDVPSDYEGRKGFLLGHGIAVWDVLRCCVRDTSRDKNITDPVPNNFAEFWGRYPGIQAVFTNGQMAKEYYERLVNDGRPMQVLPGSSSANGHLTLKEKAQAWRQELE